jgi:RNA polymerase sigma factor (sigma-70 family)
MDTTDRNRLVEQYMPLARKLVRQMWNEFYEARIGSIEDGYQLAYSALIRAVELYEPDHPSKAGLVCYICHAVRNRIRVSIVDGVIRVPASLAYDCNRRSRGKPLYFNSSPEKLDAAEHAFYGGWRLGVFQPPANAEPPSQEEFDRLLTLLPRSQAQVIRLRFGQGWTLKEVGELLGRTRQRVKQIEAAAFKSLRRLIHPDGQMIRRAVPCIR